MTKINQMPPKLTVVEWKPKKGRKTTIKNKGTLKRKIKSFSAKLKKKPQRAKLTKEADRLLSLNVRQSHADKDGLVTCYTCPYKNHWKKMQNGHYISRFFKYTRWLKENCRPQCFMCNMRLGGCAHIFREKLVLEYGEQFVKEMEQKAKILFKEPDEYIQNIINQLKEI